MFHNAALKLAGLYLAILMVISVFFSLNVYQVSIQEFDRGLRRPVGTNIRGPGVARPDPNFLRQLEDERMAQYEQAKDNLVSRLLLTNLLILIGGGLLSYYLAKRTLEPIEEAHEAQNRFTADASHELRTPLAIMQTEIEVALANSKLKLGDAKAVLNSNLEEIAKLTALSEGLLSLAKVQHGKLETEPTPLFQIVQASVDKVLPLADKKHILINNTVDDTTVVVANKATLSQALVILLDNAVKYSPDKTEVIVSATQNNKTVTIQVQDQGVGIKPGDVAHIFDRFYQADTSRSKTTAAGYGIGLAIAKNIVELQSGSISVTSQPGAGSTFSITLPAA
jgi:two-component system sensor histidine kinase CiaH